MYIGNMLAIVFLVLYEPWYITLPFVTIISNPLIGGVHCLYNNLENYYRQLLGWPLIESNFIFAIIPLIQHLVRRAASRFRKKTQL